MNRKVKVSLALFLALAVLVQYSFSPQALFAYGLNNTAATQAEEQASDDNQDSDKQETTKETDATKATEGTEPSEKVENPEGDTDESDANAGDKSESDADKPDEGEPQEGDLGEDADQEDVEYPAKTFIDDSTEIAVKVKAPEGAFQKGTEMVVKSVSHSKSLDAAVDKVVEGDVEDYKAVDITFKKDGEEVQPEKEVQVYLNASGLDAEAEKEVVHVDDSGKAAVVAEASAEGAAKVPATHFSKFIVAAKAPTGEAATRGENTWTVTFYNRDAEEHAVVEVTKGQAIGDQLPEPIAREDYTAYWAIGEIVPDPGGQGNTTKVTGERINETFVPTKDTTIVPDYAKTEYTVTFKNEEKTETIATRTVTADTNYCVNDIPAVPTKDGSRGKWVYSGGDFNNSVAASEDMEVWLEYTPTAFNVKFIVEGETYESEIYDSGDELVLPEEPVVEGKSFQGWYVGDTKYEGGEKVESDLTLTAKFKNAYKVDFVILDEETGEVSERLSQYFRTEGETIGTMPQEPFVAGKVFINWVKQGTEEEVNADTEVNGNITAVAKFRDVSVYEITAEYYYEGNSGEVIFNTDLLQVEAHELPYTITAPASTKTDPREVSGAPIYYPETPTVEVKENDFNAEKKATVRIKYVPYTAVYDFVYMLKDLEGDGYTEIDRTTNVQGVLNSYVTPTVKSFDYAVLEKAEGAIIETSGMGGQPKQELLVYYTRQHFQLTYDTKGGSYVAGVTVPYGTQQAVTDTVPTRTGYTFDGWYLDEGLTQPAGSTVTVNKNTTLYAKWKGNTVNYTIVYMFEKYNDTGTESSFVYDNSREATGQVGDTARATSAPTISRTGWEADTARNNTSSVVIAADGSSVLYVYYKLKEYTFHFRPGTVTIYYTDYDVTAPLNGQSRTGNNNYSYTFTAKLGQDISSLWLSAGNGTFRYGGRTYNVSFSGWTKTTGGSVYVTKRLSLTEDMLPSSGNSVTYEGYWLMDTVEYTVNYMLQNADDDDYTKSEKYSQTYRYSSGASLSPKDIPGYTYVRRTDSGNTTYFYYNRDTFKIDYYYGSTKLDTINSVKFDANINKSPYVWTPTAAQCGVDSDYTFEGWYSDAGLNSKYTFSTMPASNLVLYAKWKAPSYTVQFVDGDDPSSHLADNQTVEKYKKAKAPESTPTKSGYTFDGWYTTADGDDLFDWNTQITEDTTVYAHWTRDTLGYTVHYVDEEGNPVADDKVVSNPNLRVDQIVTEQAIAVAGYRPNESSQSLKLKANTSENVITFTYSAKTDKTSYTVRYILDPEEYPGNIKVAEDKTVNNISGDSASVIELAEPVDYDALYAAHPELADLEFHPDAVEKTLVLTADADKNILTFYYSSFKHATVTVNFKALHIAEKKRPLTIRSRKRLPATAH